MNRRLFIIFSFYILSLSSFSQTNDSIFTNVDNALLTPLKVKTLDHLTNGSIDNVTAFSGMDKTYDARLIETLKKYIKKWKPAMYKGRPVKYKKWVQYYLQVQ